MEDKERNFKIDTLRRRTRFLLDKIKGDDSTSARRFNLMEIEALEAGIGALEKERRHDEVSQSLVDLVVAIESGTDDELADSMEKTHDVIDRYEL